jgi:uncharacterized RDD family membrane protein YckC
MQQQSETSTMNLVAAESSNIHPTLQTPSATLSANSYPPGYGPPAGSGPPPGSLTGAEVDGVVDATLGYALAPWWKRLVAIIIDSTVLGAAYFFVIAVIGVIMQNNQGTTNTSQNGAGSVIVGVIGIVILASIPNSLYFGIMNGSKRGQTLGKMALGIAVRDARSGQKIGFWRGVGRFFIVVVFELLLYVPYILDGLSPLWTKRRQAWHDMVVRSVVVDLKS